MAYPQHYRHHAATVPPSYGDNIAPLGHSGPPGPQYEVYQHDTSGPFPAPSYPPVAAGYPAVQPHYAAVPAAHQQYPPSSSQMQYPPSSSQMQYPPSSSQMQYPSSRQPYPQQATYPVHTQHSYPVHTAPQAAAQQPYQPVQAAAPRPVPTRRRIPKLDLKDYMAKNGITEHQVIEARQEHNYPVIDLCADFDQTKSDFGLGIAYFFEFVKFLGTFCIILLLLQFIGYAAYLGAEKPEFRYIANTSQGFQNWYHPFFITRYTEKQKGVWYAMNVLSLICCASAAPLYFIVVQRRLASQLTPAEIEEESRDPKDRMLRYTAAGFLSVDTYYRSWTNLVMRRAISVLVFVVGIGIQTLASYYITKEQGDADDLWAAFGIAVLLTFLNLIYAFFSVVLTEFEAWETYSRWKRWHAFKLIAFKLCNVITVYASKRYDDLGNVRCIYDVIGEQFLMILLVDMFLTNIWKVVGAILMTKFQHTRARLTFSMNGDEDNKAPFDLALEYLECLFRYYIGVMAMTVFPLAPALTIFALATDYWVAKFRLFKLCGRPKRMSHSQKEFLCIMIVVVTVVAFFTPYAGNIIVMSGITKSSSQLCQFP